MEGLKRFLKSLPGVSALRRFRRWRTSKTDGYPRWDRILDAAAWEKARAAAAKGPKVLLATSVGGFLPGTTLESLLGVALTLRGANVEFLLCDEALPACLDSQVRWHRSAASVDPDSLTRSLCGTCFAPAEAMLRSLGLKVHRYGSSLDPEDRSKAEALAASTPAERIRDFKLDGMAVGEHAVAGALRFFARGTLEGEPQGEAVLRRYFRAALLSTFATRRLMRANRFEAAVFHHGIYVPQGLIGEVARAEKVRVVNWNVAYRKRCFIFSHGDTYHHTLMDEPVAAWEKEAWTPELEKRTLDYLKSRWKGTQDWIWFHTRPEEDPARIARETGVDFSKPTIGLLTNVMWDAQLHYPANAFPNMLEWVLRTVRWFAGRPDLQLLIRVHPAEITGAIPSRQPIVPEIRKAFPTLPSNVFLVPPESQVSTYAAMERCDSVIIYGTKTGVELTSLGIPVIVAGEAWIRNKGVTIDAASEADYFRILGELPLRRRMSEEQTRRARQYAHHFFFRRMIPLEMVEPTPGWPPYQVAEGAFPRLAAGASEGLDVICRGILEGTPFIVPAGASR